ncbi:HORMA domain-containing protein 1 [Austrofundulus limnaeus]|uniref:HORMA domain-containing protein 1 n=1 Tax=Austrofundulus limnaeus TaxID=52670 RepID=A0A2I4BZJ3_AUSLI|nr:PREDICTED: HORMA domain-containing protein 1-like [Austrofundulus limnaeus]
MACAQQERTSQVAEILPTEVSTEQQSLVVVKRLLAIAVSGITYLRGIFPARAYGNKYVEDQKVMILKGDCDCTGANQILKWMQGCFDAIEKKYLRTVIMSIYTDPKNPQNVTECYQFRIQYTTDGAHVDFESNNNQKLSTMSFGNTKKASILLVRKLYTLMQNLGTLPENICLNMKLAYYDDITPPDYQPPGFREADGDIMEFEQEPVRLSMGEVATPFHCVKFDMITEKQRLERVEESVSVKQKWVLKIEDDVITQGTVPKQVEKSDDNNTGLDNTEVQMSCDEKDGTCEKVTKMKTLVKEKSDMDVSIKRTRSGRIIKSTTEANLTVNSKLAETVKEKMVSQYEILSSQESSASVAKKKRKVSEPKDHC